MGNLSDIDRIRGISLVELLVGLLLGLIILGSVVALMISSRNNQELTYSNLELQENARFAIYFITEDFRNAGYFGCAGTLINDDRSSPVSGTQATEAGESDTISMTYSDPHDDGITTMTAIPAKIGNSDYSIRVSVSDDYCSAVPCNLGHAERRWANTEQVLISNCSAAAIANVVKVDEVGNMVTIAAESDIGIVFEPGAAIQRIVQANYTTGENEEGVSVLFRNGIELVEGIESIQYRYRTAGGNLSRPPANWDDLQGIQLSFSARSVSRKLSIDNPAALEDTESANSEQAMATRTPAQEVRQPFSSFIARRNN